MTSTLIEIDGKASIEHQIEVYVQDLIDKNLLLDTLKGLSYLFNLRMKGDQQLNLDSDLMSRLMKGLLLITGKTEGHLLRKRPTVEADIAFYLFRDFLEQVVEFRQAVNQLPVFELCDRLKINYRCQPNSTATQKKGSIAMIHLLLRYFPQCHDWKDLVKQGEHHHMKILLNSTCCEKDTSNSMLLPPQALYFDCTLEKLIKMYPQSKLETGLSSESIASLHQHYGYNTLPDPPKPNPLKMLWAQLTDFMVIILIIATIIEAIEKDFNSMSVLLVVIVLNTIIGFTQEWKANRTLNALMNLSVPKAQVIRDSKQVMIESSDLVPGDVVILEEGDAVPADLRLIQVSQLQVIESMLTGESLPVQKSIEAIKASRTRRIPVGDCKGNVFMSTTIVRGRAIGIAVRIGQYTEIGKISAALQQGTLHKIKTPIQQKLDRLGKYLVLLSIVLCVMVVAIGIAWRKDVRHMMNVGLSLAVSVIPEGLVAVTTVTMALGVRRMAKSQCIVRTLPAVESLGSVTVICSDKTGTLTEGKMGTSELWTGNDILYEFTESTSLDPEKGSILIKSPFHPSSDSLTLVEKDSNSTLVLEIDDEKVTEDSTKLLLDTAHTAQYPLHLRYAFMISSLCNNSSIAYCKETGEWKTTGDPTEIALVVASQKGKLDKMYWDNVGYKKIDEKAFDSERKLMSVVYQHADEKEMIVLCKGAPEALIRKCTTYLSKGEQIVMMNDDYANEISRESSSMASRGLRVLGLGYKSIKEKEYVENEFTFVGLIGLIDPPKQGVKEAVKTCQEAGIRVMMITGDHIKTATAIATQLGIFDPHHPKKNRAILGQELDLLSEDAMLELDPFPCVFARVSPDNKLAIVKALQKRGELVAMTGDGVNDAPAIKCADVGVAMGQAGTEITKQAADLVLLDDNFSTIVEAVEEGRHVFDNILKFIVYLLSCNGAEIFLMLICAIINVETPLTVMMILYANIIADIPPAMALGIEPKEMNLMKRMPRNPNQGVLTKVTWLIILLQSMLIAILTICVYIISLYYLHDTIESAQSLAFATLTTLQLLHSFLSRSILQSIFTLGLFGNRYMMYAFIISFSCLILGIYAPGFSSWLQLSFVNGVSWIMILICCVLQVFFVEIQKYFIRKYNGKI